jgi:hypothetical protein
MDVFGTGIKGNKYTKSRTAASIPIAILLPLFPGRFIRVKLIKTHSACRELGRYPTSFKIRCETIRCAARIALPLDSVIL